MRVIDDEVIEQVGKLDIGVAQIAELFHVTNCTVRNWVREHRFPAPRHIGSNRKKLWKLGDIMLWMCGQQHLIQFYEAKKARRASA